VISRLAVLSLAGLALSTLRASTLPEVWGDLVRGQLSSVRLSGTEQNVLDEYGLRVSERAEFMRGDRRAFIAEGFQFSDSKGGHAAYLWL
jgi:hypothetical protein